MDPLNKPHQVAPRRSVLILCTGNSCRSQMAEGLINHFLAPSWRAHSAGTEPSGYVHPLAIAAMAELSIDISNGVSKHTDDFRNLSFDVVLTVCDDADENCPLWLGSGQREHISFPDPAAVAGTDAEKMDVFREVRNDIQTQVLAFLRSYDAAGRSYPQAEE